MDRRVVALLVAAVLTTFASVAAAQEAPGQPSNQTEPLLVVDSFLLARNVQNPWGATDWVAPTIALHDVDGEWFIDGPTMSDWLQQLTSKYLVDTLSPPVADGDAVTWTERLTLRNVPSRDALASSMTLEVHAVVRDGKIIALSAPYPSFALRRPDAPPAEASAPAAAHSASIGPGTLFVGTSIGVALVALVVVKGAPVIAALHRTGS